MDEKETARRLMHLFHMFHQENAPKGKRKTGMDHRDLMMLHGIVKMNKGQPVKMSQISEYFHVTPAAVSQGIRSFENKGWVERVVLESDRRSVYIKVTPEAKKMITTKESRESRYLIRFLQYLGEEDCEALVRIMEKTVEFSKEEKRKSSMKGD